MPVVGFDAVSDELAEAEYLRVMTALIRSNLVHGADNRPALMILTDKTLFYGGTESTSGKFNRIPLKSVLGASRVGKLFWECVELRHLDIEGEKTVYICPFTGSLGSPRKDIESMEALLTELNKR